MASDLLPFGAAKTEAIRLHRSRGKGAGNWIRELNLRTAVEIDRAALAKERREVPSDIIGGGKPWPNPAHVDRALIRNIIEVETGKPLREEDTQQESLKGDDYPIEYYSDGYPELPARLDRLKPLISLAA